MPTGTVEFFDGTDEIYSTVLAGGTATFTTSDLDAATHSISALYVGDSNFASSLAAAINQVVNQVSTQTSLTSSAVSVDPDASVTFTASVTPTTGTGTPTGTVAFYDGATNIGTAQLDIYGVASFTTMQLVSGIHSITAAYAGDSNCLASTSAAVSQTVRASTSLALTSNVDPSVLGQTVMLKATVTRSLKMPSSYTGSITFMDGSTLLGTATIGSNGVATLKTAALPAGSDALTAVYSGDANYTTSNDFGAPLTQTVNQDATNTTLTGPTNAVYGQAIPLTATVKATAPGSGTPTGFVTFSNGTSVIGTAAVDASGAASLMFPSGLPVAFYNLTASYSGDGSFLTMLPQRNP